MALKLMRDRRPEVGVVFVAAPFGPTSLSTGIGFDFNTFYNLAIPYTCQPRGMKTIHAGSPHGQRDITEAAWNGIQRAPIFLVDFSGNSTNVQLLEEELQARIVGLAAELNGYSSHSLFLEKSHAIPLTIPEFRYKINSTETEPPSASSVSSRIKKR